MQIDRHDIVASIESGEVSGRIQVDADGYEHFIPASPEDKARLDAYISEELEAAIKDSEETWNRALKNRKAFNAMSDRDELLTIPICKRDALQQIAWTYNTLTRKKPIVSVTPDEPGEMQVIVPQEVDDPFLGKRIEPKAMTLTSEDEAKGLEDLLQFKLLKRQDFKKKLATVVSDCIKGETPTYLKVHYCRDEKVVRQREIVEEPVRTEEGVTVATKKALRVVDKRVPIGESARIDCVPVYNIAMVADALDPEEAPLVGEKKYQDSTALRAKISSGEYNLAPAYGSEECEALLRRRGSVYDADSSSKGLASVSGSMANAPREMHDVWHVKFYFPAKLIDINPETGEEESRIEVLSLCGDYHRAARTALSAYLNPYWHGGRGLFPFFQRQSTHQFVGESTVEDVAPFQRLASAIFHSQLANARQANMKAYLVRRGSAAWSWFDQNEVRPGSRIPFDDEKDVQPYQIGSDFRSMEPELSLVFSEAARLTNVGDYDRNLANISRTSTSTFMASQESGKQQPSMVLDLMREGLSRVLTAYVQVLQQFSPYGEQIPFQDEKTKAAISKAVYFPREAITTQFGFTITASAEDQSQEAEFEQNMMLLQQIEEDNQSSAQLLALILQPGTPPPVQKLYTKMLARKQFALGNVIPRQDKEKYILDTETVEDVLAALNQMMAEAQSQGGMTDGTEGLPPADAGADVSASSGFPGDLAAVGGELGLPADFGGAPSGALPPDLDGGEFGPAF